jgi:hypothetical protein
MKKLFVVGDSISIHYGPYLKEYLKDFMTYGRKAGEEDALLDLDNPQGANGGDSSMVLEYLTQKIASPTGLQADVLLFNCGLHDIKTDPTTGEIQIPIETYKENMKRIIDLVMTSCPATEMIWIRTTPVDDEIHNSKQKKFHRHQRDGDLYNQAADEIMSVHGIRIIDVFTFTNNLRYQGALYYDHVHFHRHIREKQGAFIAGCLSFVYK